MDNDQISRLTLIQIKCNQYLLMNVNLLTSHFTESNIHYRRVTYLFEEIALNVILTKFIKDIVQ